MTDALGCYVLECTYVPFLGNVMIATGSGKVVILNAETYKKLKSCSVDGGVTSLALKKKGHEVTVYTAVFDITPVFTYILYFTCLVLHWYISWESLPCQALSHHVLP